MLTAVTAIPQTTAAMLTTMVAATSFGSGYDAIRVAIASFKYVTDVDWRPLSRKPSLLKVAAFADIWGPLVPYEGT
jgi:hypothetical protein